MISAIVRMMINSGMPMEPNIALLQPTVEPALTSEGMNHG
jgi:hypothetical protein